MRLVKATKAFLQAFFNKGLCDHAHVAMAQTPAFCGDCREYIQLEWLFTYCTHCHAKRVPGLTFFQEVKPIDSLCRHCGHHDYRLQRKAEVEVYELMYALPVKTIASAKPDRKTAAAQVQNHHTTRAFVHQSDIFEAEIVSTSEFRGPNLNFNVKVPSAWTQPRKPNRGTLTLLAKTGR